MVINSYQARAVSLALLWTASAFAQQTLLHDNFQDGEADGWAAGGDGNVEISQYEGNFTLRLTQTAYAVAEVPTRDAGRITVGAAFAADDLEQDDACLAQVSIDKGKTWSTATRVDDGMDDAVTLHSGATSIDLPPGIDSVLILARVAGDGIDDTCWLDDVYVVGDGPAKHSPIATEKHPLTQQFLLGKRGLEEPVSMQAYTPDAVAPKHTFSGSLRLLDTAALTGFRIVSDAYDREASIGDSIQRLPEFDFEFFQRGADVIPLQRGVIRRDHPYWEIILQPGTAWIAANDDGWSRAAVPFALQERSANCTHNGVLTWLFNDHDVSRVAYQVSSETCGYFKADLWGVVEADYQPRDLSEAAAPHIARLDSHRVSRLPVRPLEQLSDTYPGTQPLAFGVEDGIHPSDMSVFGMLVDGVNYRSDCVTREGSYPFCDSMPLPTYSLAKSMFGGIATMHVEKIMPGSSQKVISTLVDECDISRWRDVSIENALDMATGNNRSADYMVDEDSEEHLEFVFSDDHAEKLDFACNYFERQFEPGTRFNYHTSDTYLVGVALQALVDDQFGFGVDVYESLLLQPLWRPLNLSVLLDDTKRTYDTMAQPFVGYGLTVEADDVLRIAAWLNDAGGIIDDEPVLDRQMLEATLQRSDDKGPETGIASLRYNNGFWAYDAGPTIGCPNSVWVPFMSGVSGITIAMFPNGVIYYYFSDSGIFRWQSGRTAANAIRSLCK